MSVELNINVDMLTWAIARAGYDLHDFIDKSPNVSKWIDGEKKPTIKQLEFFAKKVYIPFGYFFLAEPPTQELPISFFRTNNSSDNQVSINIYDTILEIQQRQDWLKEYLQENEYENLPFVGKYQGVSDVNKIVKDIRNTLNLHDNWASKYKTWEESLEILIERIEDVGIYIVFNGVVGNNTHRPIDVEECRGFVLVDEMAPFMFINNSDAKSAQMFTIVHELAHIWTGHSAGFDFRTLHPADDPIEQLCDRVAAEFLVSKEAFNDFWSSYPEIKKAARHFKVSEIVIARRALDLDKISRDDFFNFYNDYRVKIEERRIKSSSGGDFYFTTKKRLGIAYSTHINNAVKSGKLLYRDAYRLTNLKGKTFHTYFNKHF